MNGYGYNFTVQVREGLRYAREFAERERSDTVEPRHVLLGILADERGVVPALLVSAGVDLSALAERLAGVTRDSPVPSTSDTLLPFTSRAKLVLARALEEARALDHHWVGTEHILLGVLSLSPPSLPYGGERKRGFWPRIRLVLAKVRRAVVVLRTPDPAALTLLDLGVRAGDMRERVRTL